MDDEVHETAAIVRQAGDICLRKGKDGLWRALGTTAVPPQTPMECLSQEIELMGNAKPMLIPRVTIELFRMQSENDRWPQRYGTLETFEAIPYEGEFQFMDHGVLTFPTARLPLERMAACDAYWIPYVLSTPNLEPLQLFFCRDENNVDRLVRAKTGMVHC